MSYIRHKAEESLEDYLETILILSSRLSVVRSIDVATELNFSKPSVSVAVKNLKNRGYITVSEEGYLHLTEDGRTLRRISCFTRRIRFRISCRMKSRSRSIPCTITRLPVS